MTATLSSILAAAATAALASSAALAGTTIPALPPTPPPATGDWLSHTISPVNNPIFFEDPTIRTELRPIYMRHNIDNGFITKGGDVNLYALQFRWAITDRLALIATKDGYVDINPGAGPGASGWADVGLGLKYALIDDRANQFILTPGVTFEAPFGEKKVFQGNGDGEFNLFVSAAKCFGDFHLTTNVGFRLPIDGDAESSSFHYSLMADYYVCQWFIPFVSMNGSTVISNGTALPLDSEGYDLINFGSTSADTSVTLGGGFRTRIRPNLDFGFGYETAVVNPKGLFADRFTFDVIWRF